MDGQRRAGSRVVWLGLMGAVCLLGAAVGFGHSVHPSWFTFPFRVLVAVLGLLLLVLYTAWRFVVPLQGSFVSRSVIPLDEQHADVLQRRATNMADATQVQIFAASIVDPIIMRQRVTERYVPTQRALHQTVLVEARVPGSLFRKWVKAEDGTWGIDDVAGEFHEKRVLYLPVIVPPKGELFDGFSLSGAGGENISVLSHTEYLRLVACVLRTLLMQAYKADHYNDVPERARRAERTALMAIMKRGRPQKPPSTEFITKLDDGDEKVLDLMARMVARLSTHYALVAAVHCDADQRVAFAYRRDVIPAMSLGTLADGWVTWLKDRLRLLLGARPVDLTVPLDNAATCQSYHLAIESAEGLYLADQKLAVDIEDYLRHKPYVQGVPPYYRFRRRLGQTYAHFYARFFPPPGPNQSAPSLRLTYSEAPPGSVFRAMVASTAAALLVWLVGIVISMANGKELGTDIPALLLAFPAVAAAWLGFEAPSRRLLEATLAARLSLIITATTSIAASGLFMIYQTKISVLHGGLPWKMNFLGITEVSWALITALAFVNAVSTAYTCLVRTWEFGYLSKRAGND
jgi:hypothetical protein